VVVRGHRHGRLRVVDVIGDLAVSRHQTSDEGEERTIMHLTPQRKNPRTRSIATLRSFIPLGLAAAIFLLLNSPTAFAQQGNEKTFASPGEAALALYNASKAEDTQTRDAIFGSNSKEILHTGDDVADHNRLQNFVRRYEQMHRVVLEPDGTATLYIGAENWPMPISLVKNSSGAWFFDTEGGKQEVLQRRIGTNENDAIEILYALVDAQREYGSELRDGNKAKHYALRFISDEGQHNGLYWKTGDDEPPSPIGPLMVSAKGEGYEIEHGKEAPFHGYHYRILIKQGPAAKGGARSYLVDGKLTKGFAFVAYPAEYRNSGVMTFIVNQSGIVYEKDLGAKTEELASAMQEYNPDSTWNRVD
jgi:Protein of unknown function (DUF2950)